MLSFMTVILFASLQIPHSFSEGDPGPAYVPLIFSAIGIMLSIGIFINSIRDVSKKKFYLNSFFYIQVLIILAYVFLIPITGYYLTIVFFFIIMFVILRIQNLYIILFLPVAYVLFVYDDCDNIMNNPMPYSYYEILNFHPF